MGFWTNLVEKLNPAQRSIAREQGDSAPTTQTKINTLANAYTLIETVNRCINLLVDNASMVDFDIGQTLKFTGIAPNVQQGKLDMLLNMRPSPYVDMSSFRRNLLMDLLIDGNAFIYYDGTSLYHLPAARVDRKSVV